MQPKQETEDNAQLESWNMANEYMRLISNVLASMIEIWQNPYKNGMPRYSEQSSNQRILKMLASVYLDETELKEASEKYISIFINNPAENKGDHTRIPCATEDLYYEFPEWILKKLKEKGALVPPQSDPEMAL